MTISSEITKLINNLAACYTKCTSKGATIPQDENFDNLADCIDSITTPNLTSLSVTPSTTAQTLTPSSPYNGFSQVDVSAMNLQDKFVTANSPWYISITPDSGYDGLSSVGITLNNESITVTPSTSRQNIFPSSGYSGIRDVTVNPVTAAIDNNITAGNIKSGVRILGVRGTLEELNGTTTSITPTTSSQTVTPDPPYNGFTSVTVPAVTSSIDANITAGNIKKDVQILGVTGTYDGTPSPFGELFEGEIDAQGNYTMPYDLPYIGNISFDGIKNIPTNPNGGMFASYLYHQSGGQGSQTAVRLRCRLITGTVTFPDLETVSNINCFQSFCNGQSNITSVKFPKLLTTINAFMYAFQGCSSLTDIYFNSLTSSINVPNALSGVTGCTVHLPAGYTETCNLGGTNTVYLYDL